MITKLKYGNTNTFLLRGTSGNLLSDIHYVLATHYHPDHVGLVSELMKQGVKLLLMDTQRPFVHFSDDIFARDKRLHYEPISEETATVIGFAESRAFLGKLGIHGEIVATPSHSEDSISLILDSGECFVGDMEPMEYLDAYEQKEELKCDWERIMGHAPKVIYYAHANHKQL